MIVKVVIVGMLLLIIFSLGQALFYMSKGEGQSDKMLNSLTWRIGLSVLLFVLIIIGQAVGLIQPHGL